MSTGIRKTSVALAVPHHDRIKKRFGNDRQFIRCDQFPASLARFLGQLSKAIRAGIENPEDLTPLRPFIPLKETILFLENVESIVFLTLCPRLTIALSTVYSLFDRFGPHACGTLQSVLNNDNFRIQLPLEIISPQVRAIFLFTLTRSLYDNITSYNGGSELALCSHIAIAWPLSRCSRTSNV